LGAILKFHAWQEELKKICKLIRHLIHPQFKICRKKMITWLSWETTEIFPSDGVTFCMDCSLCEGRTGAWVFSDTLDIRESYALGSLAADF
jgi:hypothetical protein